MKTSTTPIDRQTGSKAAFALADGGTWHIPLIVQEATEESVRVIDKLGKEWDLRQGRKGEWLHIPDESAVMPCIFIFI